MTIFGRILSGRIVEQTVKNHLHLWMPTYIREIERQTGRPAESLPLIRSWTNRNTLQLWKEDHLPSLLLVSPGTIGAPWKDGEGTYHAHWSIGVAVVVSGRDEKTTDGLSKDYAAAVRAAMLQRQSLGGQAEGVSWLDERYTDLPADEARTLAAGQDIFSIEFKDVVSVAGGPVEPDPPAEAVGDWPEVETVITETELEDIA